MYRFLHIKKAISILLFYYFKKCKIFTFISFLDIDFIRSHKNSFENLQVTLYINH